MSLMQSWERSPWELALLDSYRCPECSLIFPFTDDLIETETYCEDCGSHLAYECPRCGDPVDSIWNAGSRG